MSVSTSVAIYFIIWWMVLFAVLPWGIRSQVETGEVVPGSDPGAPSLPKLLSKMISTTVVSAVVFVIFQIIYRYRLVGLDDLATLWGLLGRR
jgi:predicted secreted protein